MTNDSRRFGFTYGYDDAVTAAMQERTYQWMDIVFVDFGEISGDCLLRKSRPAIVLSGTAYNENAERKVKENREKEARIEKRHKEQKEIEERLEKQRAEKQEEQQYNLKVDGKDVTDLTGKLVELLGTSISIGVTESGGPTFDALA